MPPWGWTAQNPKPEPSWRRKKEIIGALHDEGAPLPAAYEFLKWRPNVTPFPPAKPPKPPKPAEPPKPAATTRKRALTAARNRRLHARRRLGKAVYRVELDSGALEDLLTASALLDLPMADNHTAVEAALKRLIEVMIADHQRAG